ncbi:MAG: hypothetical protein Q8R33_00880 [Burkholderiales bacterium]|nr:hypothetical protein [Burkholderiales bacterium]
MNIESGAGSAVVQRFERVGGVISPRELAWTLRRPNVAGTPMIDAISGFE